MGRGGGGDSMSLMHGNLSLRSHMEQKGTNGSIGPFSESSFKLRNMRIWDLELRIKSELKIKKSGNSKAQAASQGHCVTLYNQACLAIY